MATYHEPEPNALHALAHVAINIAMAASYFIILITPLVLWIMTPAGMQ